MHQIIDFAKDVLGIKLHPGQAQELSGYYESGLQNWLCLAGRRSGKSLLSDIIACYEAVIPTFEDCLREGEDRYIIVVSTRLDNAMLHIRNISKLLSRTRQFRNMITSQDKARIELSNGVVIISLPASARAGRGYTASTLIFDELAHFIDSEGNQSADRVFEAYTPTVATFNEKARVVITTTPAAKTGIVFDLFDRVQQGELEDYFLTHAASREMNPKVSERLINQAMKRDEESAMTEYMAEFRDPCEAFLSSAAVDLVIDNKLSAADKATPGKQYIMAIDPATMRDRYAFGICHEENGRVILDYAYAMKPPIDPNVAEDLLFDLARRFKPLKIKCDTASTTQRLMGKIAGLEYTPFSRKLKLEIYGALKEAINLGNLVLYPHGELIDELKALQIRNGVDISAPKSGRVTHDDLSDVLALCVSGLVVKKGMQEVQVTTNPFFGDGDKFNREVERWRQTQVHRPGVTWENCKDRMRGCEACKRETEGMFDEFDGVQVYPGYQEAVQHMIDVEQTKDNDRVQEQAVLDTFMQGVRMRRD